jgi:hypothetical protein
VPDKKVRIAFRFNYGAILMAVSRTPATFFHNENPEIDFNSKASFETLIKHLIADFYTAIKASQFSMEENKKFYVVIHALTTFLPFRVRETSPEEIEELSDGNKNVRARLSGQTKSELASSVADGTTILKTVANYFYIYRENRLLAICRGQMSDHDIIEKFKNISGAISSTASLDEKFRYATLITIGSLILCMASNDDRYGAESKFGNQLLFPSKTLVQIEKIAGIQRFDQPLLKQIQLLGEKVLSGEIDPTDMQKVLFPGQQLEKLLQQFLPKPSITAAEVNKVSPLLA